MNDLNKKINIEILNFINNNKLDFSKQYYDNTIEFYGMNHSKNIQDIDTLNLILNFDFDLPLNAFKTSKLYFLKFRDNLNSDLIDYLLIKFPNNDDFFKMITKIVPINYCIKNKHWNIVSKFLTLKPNNSNGICSIEESIDFLNNLEQYHYMNEFQNLLFTFLNNNKKILKRIEFQNHLLNFISKYNFSSLHEFITINKNNAIFTSKKECNCFLINKKNLFSKFYLKFNNKENCYNLFDLLIEKLNSIDKIKFCFLHQKDSKYTDFLIIYNLSEPFDFEKYLLYIFDKITFQNLDLDNINKITFGYFLNLSIPENNIKSINKI